MERFSLILLEPGEVYFEDFTASLEVNPLKSSPTSSATQSPIPGRLKLCSKSIVFDPRDFAKPILRIPFKHCTLIDLLDKRSSRFDDPNQCLRVSTTQYVELLENNRVAPYKFVTTKLQTFVFHFEYIQIEDYLPQFNQLHRASTLPGAEQNLMIATIVFSRHNRVQFNPLWFGSIGEYTLCDFPVQEINHLVVNPGRFLLTQHAIYFQSYNNIYSDPVKKIPLSKVIRLIRRRFLLRQVGLEITWRTIGSEDKLIYVAFKFDCDRDQFYNSVIQQQDYNGQGKGTESITLQWQNGVISNYDYLLYLNSLADRSFHDLTQYPVFPWVIADYTSDTLDLNEPKVYRDLTKPMGAQNAGRLERLLERFEEMGDPK